MNTLRKSITTVALLIALLTVSIMIGAQEATSEPITPLTDEAAQAFIEQFNRIFSEVDVSIADELYADNFTADLPLAPGMDAEAWKGYVLSFYEGISDLKQEVTGYYIAGNVLTIKVFYTGTHDGPLFGIPATGTSVTVDGIGIFTFDSEGKVTNNFAVIDLVELLAQVGAFPPAP